MTGKSLYDEGLPADLDWPSAPTDAVLITRRRDLAGRQRMWALIDGRLGSHLAVASRLSRLDPWDEFEHGPNFSNLPEAFQSDTDLTALRNDEVSVFQIVTESYWASDLVQMLHCLGNESPPTDGWPPGLQDFWADGDDQLEQSEGSFSCLPRWVAIDDYRVSCVRFNDATPEEFVPALFDQFGQVDKLLSVASYEYDEGDTNYGRPVSFSGGYHLLELRPGYAVFVTEGDAESSGEPSLVRLPVEPQGRLKAIGDFQAHLDQYYAFPTDLEEE